jgi:hypothetical protein
MRTIWRGACCAVKGTCRFIGGCFTEMFERADAQPPEGLSEIEGDLWQFARTVFYWKSWIAFAVFCWAMSAGLRIGTWIFLILCMITGMFCDLLGLF